MEEISLNQNLLRIKGLNICRFKCGIYKLNTFSNIYYMNKRKFNLFLSIIRNILMGNMYKWSVCLIMAGLGFRTYYNQHLDIYKLHIGYTHDIYIKNIKKKNFFIKTRKKFGINYIYMISTDYTYLMYIVKQICNLRISSIYKKKGIWQLTKNIRLKIGKQKNY